MYPGIQLISYELVLIPFRLVKRIICSNNINLHFHFSFKMPDVKERLRRDSEGRTGASNLVYTVWAVWGGFILHFLLSNYLTVLLRPSYEAPVETTADIIKNDITPFYAPGGEIYQQFFAASSDPSFQEVSRRLLIPNTWDEYERLMFEVPSTGLFTVMGSYPGWPIDEKEYIYWFRSSETIGGNFPFGVHLLNKKWPLKEVLCA